MEGLVRELPDLREIDFGTPSVDPSLTPGGNGGGGDKDRLSAISSTYDAWAEGNIDYRMAPDGESMRDILQRISNVLATLQRAASESPERSVVVVSHAGFLSVLVAVCQQQHQEQQQK